MISSASATPCKLKIGRLISRDNIAIENIIAARIVGKLIPANKAYPQAMMIDEAAATLKGGIFRIPTSATNTLTMINP